MLLDCNFAEKITVMKHQTKNQPQVKVVKRYTGFKRPIIYVLVSNLYNEDNTIIFKLFSHYDIGKSTKAEPLN